MQENTFMLNHPFHDDNYLRGKTSTARDASEKSSISMSVSMSSVTELAPQAAEHLLRYSAEVRSILLSLSQLVDVTVESKKIEAVLAS
jgi:hypothetical protein